MISTLYRFVLTIRVNIPKLILGIPKFIIFLVKSTPKLIIFLVKSILKLMLFLVKTIKLGIIGVDDILDEFHPISTLLYFITFTVAGLIIGVKIMDTTNYNFGLQLIIITIIFTTSMIIFNLLTTIIVGIIMRLRGEYNDKNYL